MIHTNSHVGRRFPNDLSSEQACEEQENIQFLKGRPHTGIPPGSDGKTLPALSISTWQQQNKISKMERCRLTRGSSSKLVRSCKKEKKIHPQKVSDFIHTYVSISSMYTYMFLYGHVCIYIYIYFIHIKPPSVNIHKMAIFSTFNPNETSSLLLTFSLQSPSVSKLCSMFLNPQVKE